MRPSSPTQKPVAPSRLKLNAWQPGASIREMPSLGLSARPMPLRAADDALAVVNPVLLVEVTSASTEDYDRGEKLRHYKGLPSLGEVLFVSHRGPELTLHRREDTGWTVSTAGPGESLELASVAARVAVDEVYRDGLEDAGGLP